MDHLWCLSLGALEQRMGQQYSYMVSQNDCTTLVGWLLLCRMSVGVRLLLSTAMGGAVATQLGVCMPGAHWC